MTVRKGSQADQLRGYQPETPQGPSPAEQLAETLADVRRRLEEYRKARTSALERIRGEEPEPARVSLSRIDVEIKQLNVRERYLARRFEAA